MAIAMIVSVLCIPAGAINRQVARGREDGHREDREHPSGRRVPLTCRPLLIFAACVVLLHLANVAMSPLVGQKLALADCNQDPALMSDRIVIAQRMMVPMAIVVGDNANFWGTRLCLCRVSRC
jgi:hypothetical protein